MFEAGGTKTIWGIFPPFLILSLSLPVDLIVPFMVQWQNPERDPGTFDIPSWSPGEKMLLLSHPFINLVPPLLQNGSLSTREEVL